MEPRILVGTVDGLRGIDALAGCTVTALARDGARTWALVDGRMVWVSDDARRWELEATLEGPPATCLAPGPAGVLIGTEGAHLLRLAAGQVSPLASFERVEGRETWYTPWGDPADVRSIAAAPDEAVHVNVHVGGVVRSRDAGASWAPTLDIEADVHQVIVHPARPRVVLAAAAAGLGLSRDGGDSWEFITAGLHAHYLRAVAIAGETVLVTASTGHRGRRSAVYTRRLDGQHDFERCGQGLPEWFDDNIDTGCLGAAGPVVAFGTEDGRLYRSLDSGASWELLAKGLPAVRCVLVG